MKKIQNRLDTLYKRQVRIISRVAMLIASLLILFFVSSKLASIGWADGGTTVSIDPDSRDVGLGSTATTDVLVEDVTNLYGFEFQITFDPTLVEGVQVQPGDFLSPDWEIDNTIDNANGIIDYALGQQNPSTPITGSGTLAIITWRGKAVGTSPITLTHVLLGTAGGISITTGTQDGEITVVAASIGDYVWIDESGDGKQGLPFPGSPADEVGINDVDMELWEDTDASGTFSETMDTRVMTTTTQTNLDNDGWYLFTGLGAGTYFVRIAPAEFDSGGTLWDYNPTEPDAGSDDTVDSDGDNPTCLYDSGTKTGTCGQALFEDNILAKTTLSVSDDLTIDFGVVVGAPPTAVTLSSFAAESSAGSSVSLVWLGLVGLTVLAAGSLFWAKRRAGW